jgi:hypothetical protein
MTDLALGGVAGTDGYGQLRYTKKGQQVLELDPTSARAQKHDRRQMRIFCHQDEIEGKRGTIRGKVYL